MHFKVHLATLEAEGPVALPAPLVGLSADSLADLSAAIDPCPIEWAGLGFWPWREEVPAWDPDTQKLGDVPSLTPDVDGCVVIVRRPVVDLTEAEIEALALSRLPPAPIQVTNAQARAALMRAGLFTEVDAAIKAVGGEALQFWEYANDVTRNGPLVNQMAASLGLTAEQLDTLFRIAGGIEA